MPDLENQNLNHQNKNKFFNKLTLVFVLILILISIFLWSYETYLSPDAKLKKEQQKNYEKFQKWQARYEKAMREDTYGGKTPEETLNLFIAALKKEDIDLAAKYFVLNSNGEQDPKWKEALLKTKESGKLKEVINILSKAKPDPGAAISKDYYVFSSRDKNGVVIADIDLRLNEYSNVWKIISL